MFLAAVSSNCCQATELVATARWLTSDINLTVCAHKVSMRRSDHPGQYALHVLALQASSLHAKKQPENNKPRLTHPHMTFNQARLRQAQQGSRHLASHN